MISAGFDSDYKSFMAFLASGDARLRFVMAQVTYDAAKSLHEALKTGFPKSMNGARAALRLGRVNAGRGSAAYGVYLDSAGMQSKKARKIDPAVNVFYIRPKKGRMVRVPEKIRILQQYSPWTMDSLPFFPSKREGSVITRKVSEKEATQVRQLREQDRTKWAPLLAKEGIHVTKATKVKLPPRAQVVEDVAFRALRLEFGGGDQSAKPIWRPTIRSLAKNVVRSMLAGSVASALSDPRFRGFLALPKAEIDLSENGLGGYKEFVKRLRV